MATPLRRATGLALVAILTVAAFAGCTGKKAREEATPDSGSVATGPSATDSSDSTGPGATDDLPLTTGSAVAPTTTAPVETTTTTAAGPPAPGRTTTTRPATTTTTMAPYAALWQGQCISDQHNGYAIQASVTWSDGFVENLDKPGPYTVTTPHAVTGPRGSTVDLTVVGPKCTIAVTPGPRGG